MYELLSENIETIRTLTKAGVIDPHWLRDVQMFEDFNSIKTNCTMCKYSELAQKYGINEESVRKRIKEMRG